MSLFERAAAEIASSRQIEEDFQALCRCGGRFAGTPSEERARQYLIGRLTEIAGTVEQVPVPYRGWTRGPASIALPDGQRFAATPLGRSPSTSPNGLRAPFIDLGRGAPDDFARAGERVRGRIVLVRHEYMLGSGHIHRRKKYQLAKAAGAVGFLIACHLPGELLVTGSAGAAHADDLPCAGISHESGLALAGYEGDVVLRTQGEFADRTAHNLIARIPGRTEESIVLSAHIDGHDLAESAIDNASGLACVLAVASALRLHVGAMRRGLTVGLFNVEEWAVIGSQHYLQNFPERERRALAFNVNVDSATGSSRLAVMTSGIASSEAALARANEKHGLDLARHAIYMGNSDHGSFIKNGIPALRLCAGLDEPQSNLRFLLTAGDTADKVRPSELRAAATATIALTLAVLEADIDPLSPQDVARITGE